MAIQSDTSQLTAESAQGVFMASVCASAPGMNDGLTNALAQIGPNGGQVALDPLYTGSDSIEELGSEGYRSDRRSHKYPLSLTITDTRNGTSQTLTNNVDGQYGAAAKTIGFRYDQHHNPLVENGSIGILLSGFVGAQGTYSYGSEFNGNLVNFYHTIASKSISGLINGVIVKSGTGDFPLDYRYARYYGGQINGDDEGFVGYSIHMDEGGSGQGGNRVPSMQISSSGAGPVAFEVYLRGSIVNGNTDLGTGRYALLMKNADGSDANVLTANCTGSNIIDDSYSTMTIPQTLPQSQWIAAYGKMDQIFVPYNNDVPQRVVNVTVRGIAGTSGAFVPGVATLVSFRRNERCVILGGADAPSAVNGGVQTISILVRQNHDGTRNNESGSSYFHYYIFQDPQVSGKSAGLGQTVVRFGFYDQGQGSPVQAVPCAGALDAHTLVICANYIRGQFNFIPPQPVSATVQLSAVDGQGMVSFYGDNPERVNLTHYVGNHRTAISNSGTAGYDGPVSLSYFDYNLFKFHPNNPATPTATPIVKLTIGENINQVKFYRGVEVLGVCDPSQPTDRLGTYMLLEPNDIHWPTGGVVDQPGHYSTGMSFESIGMNSTIPALTGQAACSLQISGPVGQGPLICHNESLSNDDSNYQLSGGYWTRPTWTSLNGPWGDLFSLRGVTNPELTVFNLPDYNPAYARHILNLYLWKSKSGFGNRQIDYANDSITDYFAGGSYSMNSQGFFFQGHPMYLGNQVLDQLAPAQYDQQATPLGQVKELIAKGDPTAYTGTLEVVTPSGNKTLTIIGGRIAKVS